MVEPCNVGPASTSTRKFSHLQKSRNKLYHPLIYRDYYLEYPRFPLETLVDGGGDCEDTSFLFATLTLIMGYETVYISPPEHYAVGVWGSDLSDYSYTYDNKTYYYCETTGDGFKIGDIPTEYKNQEVRIYDIKINEQYDPKTGTIPIDSIFIYLELVLVLLIIITIIYYIQHSGSAKKGRRLLPITKL